MIGRRRIDIFAVLLAVFILGLGAYLSTYPVDTERLTGSLIMAASIIALIIWFSWGHLTPATWTESGAIRNGRIRALIGIALLCSLLGGGYVASSWPAGVTLPWRPSSQVPAPRAPLPSQSTVASADRFIFSCSGIGAVEFTVKMDSLKANLPIWGDAIGFGIAFSDVAGGVRITVESKTPDAKNRLLSFGVVSNIKKLIIEVRLISQQVIVTVYGELPPTLKYFALISADPGWPQVQSAIKEIAATLGLQPNECRLI